MNVKMPDGKVVAFPDTMSQPEITAVLDKQYAAAETKPPTDSGFLSTVGQDISKRAGNVADIFTSNVPPDESLMQSIGKVPSRAMQTVGQGAGLINDIAVEGMKAGYKAVVPEDVRGFIGERNKAVFAGIDTPPIREGATSLMDIYGGAKKQFPEGMRNVEAVANIAGAVPIVKGITALGSGVKVAGKEAVNVTKDIAAMVGQQTETGIAKKIETAIRYGIEKSIRPSVAGKGTAVQIKAYHDRAVDAVKNIVANKENLALTDAEGNIIKGALPKSLNQFSEAVDQTKKTIFRQYDDLAKQAGDKGATVDLTSIADELSTLAESKVTNTVSPGVANYAQKRAAAFTDAKVFTAEEAQEAIAQLNTSLKAFYKNPTYETASTAGVDALIANNLRKALDDVIENTTGAGYQKLKSSYGALKTIEKDVAHRAIVDARKNVKGLLDFTDIFTSGELLAGLATMNPSMVLRAGAWKGVKEYFKMMNNPNRVVRNMFGDVETIIEKSKPTLKSASMQSLTGRSFVSDIPKPSTPSGRAVLSGDVGGEFGTAAFRMKDGTIYTGASHPQIAIEQVAKGNVKSHRVFFDAESGFVNSKGKFFTRDQILDFYNR